MTRVAVRVGGGGSEGQREAFPADTYICEVNQAELVESQFKDDKTGEVKWQIKLTWEVCQLSPEQEEAGLETGKWFFMWLEPWYGTTAKRGPSKFKMFIDSLMEQGILEGFDPADFDTDDLVGKRQKVTVQEFKRPDGTTGNKVTGVLPLKLRRAAPAARPAPPLTVEPSPARVGARPRGAIPAPHNELVAVADGGDDLF